MTKLHVKPMLNAEGVPYLQVTHMVALHARLSKCMLVVLLRREYRIVRAGISRR